MSNDQRPAKVRVFSSNSGSGTSARRRGDNAAPQLPSVTEPVATPAPAENTGSTRPLALAVLFMLGCAIGGALLAWFGLMPGATS